MPKPDTILEWDVLLDDREWNSPGSFDELMRAKAALPSSQRRTWTYRLWALAGSTLFVALAAGLFLWYSATLGTSYIEAEIRDVVEIERWVEQTGNRAAAGILVDSQADREWRDEFDSTIVHRGSITDADFALPRTEIVNITLRSNMAMVELTAGEPGERYRETRFYREDENGGWLRTSPQVVFWGREQTLETDHFCIHFRRRDTGAVVDAAVRLDELHAQLLRDAGLPVGQNTLTVEVKPLSPQQLGYLQFEGNRLEAPSPLLVRAPEEVTRATVLVKSIVNPLVTYVLLEAQQKAPPRPEWRPMLKGWELWQAYVGSDLLVPWFYETVAWLYAGAEESHLSRRLAPPSDLLLLCRDYDIWRYTLPDDLALPWLCEDPKEVLHLPATAIAPLHLTAFLGLAGEDRSTRAWNREWARGIGAATVIDYIVDTYGREQLPALIAGFGAYTTWDDLAPAVLGIPAQELEIRWLAHLLDQVGTDGRLIESKLQFNPR